MKRFSRLHVLRDTLFMMNKYRSRGEWRAVFWEFVLRLPLLIIPPEDWRERGQAES